MPTLPRRQFLQTLAATAAVTGLSSGSAFAQEEKKDDTPFKISLAEWSLHKSLFNAASGITNLDFPRIAKEEFGIDGVEYVNQFFKDKARDQKYLADLKQRCDDVDVTSVLIMVDGEGNIGDPDKAKRKQAVENHHQWVDAAKYLGCHSIRVNASSGGSYLQQVNRAADGLRQLSEYAAKQDINVLVENHGGLSSNAAWLAVVMERVGMENCGTLPDFGNFNISGGDNPQSFDRYMGVQALMPYAKAVSAKTYDFNDEGDETAIDYLKIMQIVMDFGYHGYVGIEYEGSRLDEYAGIRASKTLLERVREKLA